jgi:hypothetical protein
VNNATAAMLQAGGIKQAAELVAAKNVAIDTAV